MTCEQFDELWRRLDCDSPTTNPLRDGVATAAVLGQLRDAWAPAAQLFSRDPVEMWRAVGREPDPWQRDLLTRGEWVQALVLCGRQTGKSTVAASLALHTALAVPNSTTLIISRSLRQAAELKRKVDEFHHGLLAGGAPLKAMRRGGRFKPLPWRVNRRLHEESLDDEDAVRNSVLSLELANGSRILAMPCSADTSVGFTIDLLIYDEAARIPDAVYYPMRPTVARARSRGQGGRVIALTTPNGKRGWFWESWDRCQRARERGESPDWEVVRVPAGVLEDGKIRLGGCPHLSVEFLQSEYGELGSRWWLQEYGIEFVDALDQVFSQADIDRALRVVDDGLALQEDV